MVVKFTLEQIRQNLPSSIFAVLQYVTNDVPGGTEEGQQRSTIIRLIIITTLRSMSSMNQYQFIILKLSDLGHNIRGFRPYPLYAE